MMELTDPEIYNLIMRTKQLDTLFQDDYLANQILELKWSS